MSDTKPPEGTEDPAILHTKLALEALARHDANKILIEAAGAGENQSRVLIDAMTRMLIDIANLEATRYLLTQEPAFTFPEEAIIEALAEADIAYGMSPYEAIAVIKTALGIPTDTEEVESPS